MKKKLLIVALVAGLLPTLFSCSTRNDELYSLLKKESPVEEVVGGHIGSGIFIHVVKTHDEAITIFSRQDCGSVIIDRKSIKR